MPLTLHLPFTHHEPFIPRPFRAIECRVEGLNVFFRISMVFAKKVVFLQPHN